MHGDIGAAPQVGHGDAHIGRGQGGRIVDTVAHHHHRQSLLFQGCNLCGLVAWQHIADDLLWLQADPFCHGQRGGGVVAREHHDPYAAFPQGGNGRTGLRFGFITKGQHRQGLQAGGCLLCHDGQGCPLVRQVLQVLLQGVGLHPQLLHPAQAANQIVFSVDLAAQTLARDALQLRHRWQDQSLVQGCRDHSTGQRVATAALQSSCQG